MAEFDDLYTERQPPFSRLQIPGGAPRQPYRERGTSPLLDFLGEHLGEIPPEVLAGFLWRLAKLRKGRLQAGGRGEDDPDYRIRRLLRIPTVWEGEGQIAPSETGEWRFPLRQFDPGPPQGQWPQDIPMPRRDPRDGRETLYERI